MAPRLGTSPGQRVNYMAWTGLLVSVSGFIFNFGVNGIVGIIFSILGLREARRLADAGQQSTGRQLAVAGIITGIAHIIVTAGIVVLSVFALLLVHGLDQHADDPDPELEPELAVQLGSRRRVAR